jgi:hypothetical protein
MTDEANPQGMERPIIPMKGARPRIKMKHKGSAPEQPSAGARPMLSIHAKNAGRPTLPLNTESDPAPPQGMERPRLQLKTRTPGVADDRDMYDEPDDGLDVPDFVQPKNRPY